MSAFKVIITFDVEAPSRAEASDLAYLSLEGLSKHLPSQHALRALRSNRVTIEKKAANDGAQSASLQVVPGEGDG